MRTIPKWVNKIHEADKVEFSSVHSICYSPDGSQLVMGAGERVMVYAPGDGALLQLLRAHRGAVHCVAYAPDGRRFASGSADKNVIIWSHKMEGVLKYAHSEAIQCIAYNPVTSQLASCALSDFAFWSAEVKAVQKHRVAGRITCCAWAPAGAHLAVGLASGLVSVRDKSGEEVSRVSREACVWAVAFSAAGALLVADWSDTLSFHSLQGQQLMKDRDIGISALSMALIGELIVVGGVGGWAVLTSEGLPILTTSLEWVWCVAPSPSHHTLAVACQDGTLWCYQIVFSTVHALYRERYAFRENMTDVIVQHLTTGSKVRIKCHDRVQKIAIHKNRLAVQLAERVVVYEQGDSEGLLYRVKEKLPQKAECSLLVATSDSLLLCQDTKLIMIGKPFSRTWNVPSPIRYVKVTPLRFKEVLLLGLLNGEVWKVDPESPGAAAAAVLRTPAAVRCLDLSASKARVAVVDDQSACRVYDLRTGELLFQEENVTSVSWNSCCEELLCLSGSSLLSIKAGSFPASTQPLQGSVVGFQGGRVFCLQSNSMNTVNVPLSHAMHQYLQHNMFSEAYAVACLGVTACDWERLGFAALEELSFEVARKAFQRSDNIIYLTLIDNLQERLEAGEKRGVVLGSALAHRGRLADAARAFRAAGRDDRALHMYTDLRMFNKAQEYVGEGESGAALVRRRAEWARHVNEPRAAAEMFLAAGDVARAAAIMAQNGWSDMLMETARKMDKGSGSALRHVAAALATAGEPRAAADVYQRLGDYRMVAQLLVTAGQWSRALELCRERPECRRDVYVPYAHAMAREERFVEVQRAYHMAGETERAARVLTTLVRSALGEERYSDAAYLHHLLAAQCLEAAAGADEIESGRCVAQYERNDRLARVYYAYDTVHRSVHEPFSMCQPETLFNAARLVLALASPPPPAVSMFCVYLCLAKQARALGAAAAARRALDRLLGLQVPAKFQESAELLSLKARAEGGGGGGGGGAGEEEAAVLCWRCRRHAPPLVAAACPHCQHPVLHSYVSFEVLPLVELEPASDVPPAEVLELLERSPPAPDDDGGERGGADVVRIDADTPDLFLSRLDSTEEGPTVVCSRAELLAVPPGSVLAVPRAAPLRPRYYRNMLPDLLLTACANCYKLFYAEDFEMQRIKKGGCPFCRHAPPAGEEGGEREDEGWSADGHRLALSEPLSPEPTSNFNYY